MECKFDPGKCTVKCGSYPMCAYQSIQNQLSELNSQFNFIYKTLSQLSTINQNLVEDMKMLKTRQKTDSEKITNKSRSQYDEEKD